jgi:hypothetical protein
MTNDGGSQIGGGTLISEVYRYLTAVDTFRAAGREPRWLPERNCPDGSEPWEQRPRRRRRNRCGEGTS